MKYIKHKPSGYIDVFDGKKNIGQIRQESPPFGSPEAEIFRFWPFDTSPRIPKTTGFSSVDALKQFLENYR